MHHRDSQKVVYKKNQSSLLFQLFVLGLLGFFPLVLGLEGFFLVIWFGCGFGVFWGDKGLFFFYVKIQETEREGQRTNLSKEAAHHRQAQAVHS